MLSDRIRMPVGDPRAGRWGRARDEPSGDHERPCVAPHLKRPEPSLRPAQSGNHEDLVDLLARLLPVPHEGELTVVGRPARGAGVLGQEQRLAPAEQCHVEVRRPVRGSDKGQLVPVVRQRGAPLRTRVARDGPDRRRGRLPGPPEPEAGDSHERAEDQESHRSDLRARADPCLTPPSRAGRLPEPSPRRRRHSRTRAPSARSGREGCRRLRSGAPRRARPGSTPTPRCRARACLGSPRETRPRGDARGAARAVEAPSG